MGQEICSKFHNYYLDYVHDNLYLFVCFFKAAILHSETP